MGVLFPERRKVEITMKIVNCAPTWEGILPVILDLYVKGRNGRSAEKQKVESDMMEELRKMASAADKWNEYCETQRKKRHIKKRAKK